MAPEVKSDYDTISEYLEYVPYGGYIKAGIDLVKWLYSSDEEAPYEKALERLRQEIERINTRLTDAEKRLNQLVVEVARTQNIARVRLSPLGWWGFGPAADRGGWALVCR